MIRAHFWGFFLVKSYQILKGTHWAHASKKGKEIMQVTDTLL